MAKNGTLLEQYDDLPEHLILLKELAKIQADIINLQRLENEALMKENQSLHRKNKTLRQLICTPN